MDKIVRNILKTIPYFVYTNCSFCQTWMIYILTDVGDTKVSCRVIRSELWQISRVFLEFKILQKLVLQHNGDCIRCKDIEHIMCKCDVLSRLDTKLWTHTSYQEISVHYGCGKTYIHVSFMYEIAKAKNLCVVGVNTYWIPVTCRVCIRRDLY